jgi:ATP-dependent helicase/DNAse subunit B
MINKDNDGIEKSNGWTEWGRYVLKTLETISFRIEDLQKEINSIKTSMLESNFALKDEVREEIKTTIASNKQSIDILDSKIDNIDKDLTAQKVRSSIIGAVIGLVGAGIVTLIVHIAKEFILK